MPLKICVVGWNSLFLSYGTTHEVTGSLGAFLRRKKLTNLYCYWADPHFSCSNQSDYSGCHRKWSETQTMLASAMASWHRLLEVASWTASRHHSHSRRARCRTLHWFCWSNTFDRNRRSLCCHRHYAVCYCWCYLCYCYYYLVN